MAENERIYRDLGTIRYKLYDVSIEQGVDIWSIFIYDIF
jgi:hypothetical protein